MAWIACTKRLKAREEGRYLVADDMDTSSVEIKDNGGLDGLDSLHVEIRS